MTGNAGADSGRGSDGAGAAGEPGAGGPERPGDLLGEMRAIRDRARRARHAYWFPLILFGVLIGASVPFYLPRHPAAGASLLRPAPGPAFLQNGYLGGAGLAGYRGAAYYWLGAMLAGIAATVLWYRWHGSRVGLRTAARGYLITGLILVALALLLPLAGGAMALMPYNLVGRGTFPFVLIGLGLCYLAWAERSRALAVIAVVFLALAVLANLYNIENVLWNWFGVPFSMTVGALPNVLLPAVVLLASGAGAIAVQHRGRRRGGAAAAGPAEQAR